MIFDDVPARTAEKGVWTLRLPKVPLSYNVLRHTHWAQYSKIMEEWFYLVRSCDMFLDISRPTGKRWIVITRNGIKRLDRDNLYASVKPIIDVLRPPVTKSGVYATGIRKGQPWTRSRIGHGLILEDDEDHLELKVKNGKKLDKGEKPYVTIIISDFPIPED